MTGWGLCVGFLGSFGHLGFGDDRHGVCPVVVMAHVGIDAAEDDRFGENDFPAGEAKAAKFQRTGDIVTAVPVGRIVPEVL